MKIGGFQKMTMLDFPGKIACTVFTYGCNLRCPFCNNATLVTHKSELFSEDEILAYLNKRKGILDGICITGGEPLLQADIIPFMQRVKEIGLAIKLDTNGAYPDRLKEIIDLGLVDYIAMDIKNSKEKYPLTTGIEGLDITPFEKSVEIIKNSGVDYEFRTTVVRELHTIDDMKKIAEWISGAKRYYIQCFADSGELIGEGFSAHDKNTLEAFCQATLSHISSAEIRGI
jgi:pyruvate formate lyase activating enzyme